VIGWIRRLFARRTHVPAPTDSLHSVAERAVVVDALWRTTTVEPAAHLVGPIAIAARRYVLALQRHHDEGLDTREAMAIERQLWKVLREAISNVPGVPISLAPVIAHDVCRRFSTLEVGS
jgi:hypothetical protein